MHAKEMIMKGYQTKFFTQQDRRHTHKPVADWLMLTARGFGIRGSTIVAARLG